MRYCTWSVFLPMFPACFLPPGQRNRRAFILRNQETETRGTVFLAEKKHCFFVSWGNSFPKKQKYEPGLRVHCGPHSRIPVLRRCLMGWHGSTSVGVGPTVDSYGPPPLESSQAYMGQHVCKLVIIKMISCFDFAVPVFPNKPPPRQFYVRSRPISNRWHNRRFVNCFSSFSTRNP